MPNKIFFGLIFFVCNCRYRMYNRGKERDKKMNTMIRPVAGMYFSAIRNRDDRVFVGQIESVKNIPVKGKMVVVKLDGGKYASVYLDECYDYAWSDFPLPALQGR